MKRSNFDELNENGKIVVKAKTLAAKDLEKLSSPYEQLAQKLKKSFNQNNDIIGKFRNTGKGKLASFAGALALGNKFLAGESVNAQEGLKAATEILNPLPFSMDEISVEMKKMNPEKYAEQFEMKKEQKRQAGELAALPGALEFGKKLQEMMRVKNMSKNK